MENEIRVLHVDDEPEFIEMASELLEREGELLTVETATSPIEGLEHIQADDIHCIVSDFEMPDQDGIEFLESVREQDPELPFILFTGKGSEEIASEAISSGVTDYLQKSSGTEQYAVLANRILNAVAQYRAKQAARESERRLEQTYERITDGFFGVDADWHYTYINEEGARLVGRDRDELLGKTVWEAFPELRDSPFGAALRKAQETGERTTLKEYYPAHDSWYDVQVYPDKSGISIYFKDVSDQKSYERQLDTIIDSLPGFVCRHRMEAGWPLEFVKGSPETITGYTGEELENEINFIEEIVHPEDRESVQSDIAKGLDEADGYELSYRIVTKDGQTKWIKEHGGIVTDPGSDVKRFDGFITDITAQKEYELELEQERERFEALFANFPEPTLATDLIDGDPIIRSVNPAFEETFGIDEKEAIGQSVNDLIVPSGGMEKATDIDQQVVDGNIVDVEVRRQTASGDRNFNVRSIPVDLEVGPDSFVVYVDIHERKRREEHFRRLHEVDAEFSGCETATEVYEVLVDSAEGVLDHDLAIADAVEDGILVPKAVSTELPASSYFDETPVDAEDNLAARAYRTGETSLVRDLAALAITPADPSYRSALTIPIPEFGIFQTVSKEVGAFDETDKNLTEVLVAHARRHLIRIENRRELIDRTEELERQNERLDEFASIVSHDLKNPLNVASGRLSLAQEECQSEHLPEIERAHRRMETLIENLLSLARIGGHAAKEEPLDVKELVDQCWRTVETSNATLNNNVEMTAIADTNRLQQLLENLFSNAIEHAGEDVEITVGELDDGFFVEDTGPGLPTDDIESLFEAGFSTKEDGTGFGLNIVKQIVDAHDWHIDAGNGLQGGARFEITGVERAG